MSDEEMRRALREKLSDPGWKARQAKLYRDIVGESEVRFAGPTESEIRFSKPGMAQWHEPVIPADPPEPEEEPDTVEALWMGNWQRSAGALTLTRFPDGTIALDYPAGGRTLFASCAAPRGRFSWFSETVSAAGRGTETYRCPDRYETADEALLEMHRAAHALFAEVVSEREG